LVALLDPGLVSNELEAVACLHQKYGPTAFRKLLNVVIAEECDINRDGLMFVDKVGNILG
jgi:hypothetical protein